MADVKWIKITTDMFDNRKIRHLRKLPDGNSIVLIWVMLLTMAGRCNAGGMIFLTENIPYTTKMLADELDFEENTVSLALKSLEQLGMVTSEPLQITNWEEYQSADRLQELREYNRLAQQKSRERKRLAASSGNTENNDSKQCQTNVNDKSMTSQRCQDIDIDIDKDIDKDKEDIVSCNSSSYDSELQLTRRTDVRRIVDKWNEIGVSPIKEFTPETNRAKMLFTRIREHGIENVLQAIDNVKQSDFLKGQNGRGWVVTFDWFVKPNNFQKVLEGNYNPSKAGQKFYGEKRGTSTSNMILDMIKNGEFDE